jgi:pimeloyl-ACP methyl ester carboxylesterase
MECFFEAPGGISIAADVFPGDRSTIVFLPGGGQTRQSWKTGAESMAAAGYDVVSLDLRGHGQSSWALDSDYGLSAYISDLQAVLAQIRPQPILIGASLGGLICATAIGESGDHIARALVLVDVTPRVNPQGSRRILNFMSANKNGFGSLEEVAEVVAAYNPHRPRPTDISGLRRNVREINGRLYWHWDPQLLSASTSSTAVDEFFNRAQAAATRIRVPTLLVRGVLSDLVGPEEVEWFKRAVPHAQYVDIDGAGHMVAGDRNDAFNGAILEFIDRLERSP